MAIPSWLEITDKTSGTGDAVLDVTAEENLGEARNVTLIVSGNGLTQSVEVTQEMTKKRKLTFKVALETFGHSTNLTGYAEAAYRIWLESDYPLVGGSITAKFNMNQGSSTKTFTIYEGATKSSYQYHFIQLHEMFSTNERIDASYIEHESVGTIYANSTSNEITNLSNNTYIPIEFIETGILKINSKWINTNTFEFKNEYNKDIDDGVDFFTAYGNYMVSWPYIGGFNRCDYNFKKIVGNNYIDVVFNLNTVDFMYDNTNDISARYYDIWSAIFSDGYAVVKSFTLRKDLSTSTYKIVNIKYLEGNMGQITWEEDGTFTSVDHPIFAGLTEQSPLLIKYSSLRLVDTVTGPSGIQICWYHNNSKSDDIEKSIIRMLRSSVDFSDNIQNTDIELSLVTCYSDEIAAYLSTTLANVSDEYSLETFYHPYKRPISTVYQTI